MNDLHLKGLFHDPGKPSNSSRGGKVQILAAYKESTSPGRERD